MTVDVKPESVGARLQEHRRLRSLTQSEVAKRLGVSRPTIAAIEAGHRRLNASLIVDLAAAYEIPVSELVRQPAPTPSLSAQFRVPLSASPVDRDRLEQAVTSLELLVRDYLHLEALLDSPLRPTPTPAYSFSPTRTEDDAGFVADAERRRLGLGDGPLLGLRDVLERELGLRIFSLDLPNDVAGLFGTSEIAGGCVGINARHALTRQRWTLGHEAAHFLVAHDRPEVTRVEGYHRVPDVERFAEGFAAAFLMPRSGLERRLRDVVRSGKQPTVADLLVLANEYGVSAQALVLRLEDLRFVSAGQWDRIKASRLQLREANTLLGLDDPSPDQRRFPRRFVLLAIGAYESELITEHDLAAYLRIDRLRSRMILEGLSNSPDGANGGFGHLLDLGESVVLDV